MESSRRPALPSSACHHFLCDGASYQPSLPMGKIEKYHVPLRTDDGAKWHQEYLLLVTGGKEVSSGKSVISSTEVEQVSISLDSGRPLIYRVCKLAHILQVKSPMPFCDESTWETLPSGITLLVTGHTGVCRPWCQVCRERVVLDTMECPSYF